MSLVTGLLGRKEFGAPAVRSELRQLEDLFAGIVSAILRRRRNGFIFRERRIHLIPGLRVGNEKVHLRPKPAWIIQTARGNSHNARGPFLGLRPSQPRAAVGAKAALVSAARR